MTVGREDLVRVAEALGDLRDRVVFVGGAVPELPVGCAVPARCGVCDFHDTARASGRSFAEGSRLDGDGRPDNLRIAAADARPRCAW